MDYLMNNPAIPEFLQRDLQHTAKRYVDCLIAYHADGSKGSYHMLVATQNLLNDLAAQAAMYHLPEGVL